MFIFGSSRADQMGKYFFIAVAALVLSIGMGSTPAQAQAVDTILNNFTMLDSAGNIVGGTNDVHFTWDGTLKTSVTNTLIGDPLQVSNATITSPCPFFGITWSAHDVAIYGPGTYTVYAGCLSGNPGCGSGASYTFTVGAGEMGGHMLFDWSTNKNIDLVNIWKSGVFAPSKMHVDACGTNHPAKIWELMSTDWDNNGVNGIGFIDGPFVGFNGNFNLQLIQGCFCGDGCNDGNDCNGVEVCDPLAGPSGGHCYCETLEPECDDNNPCTDDSCDVDGVTCLHTPNTNPCTNDNPLCFSGGGTCANGFCGVPLCDDGKYCTIDLCDSATGVCTYDTLTRRFLPCDNGDGNACTGRCGMGGLCNNTAVTCEDYNECTDNSCDTATGCVFTINDALICTASPCNGNDSTCSAGVCGGTPVDCNDNNVCTTDWCDEVTGNCLHTQNSGAVCDDGDMCTENDTCSIGVCAGTAINCSDNNACTADSCDTATGCVNAAISCDDGNVCTTDSCDTATGCVYANNTAACDDGNLCTTGDVCSGGSCAGTAVDCNDNNPCTDDSCDPALGCVFTNNTAPCDDGAFCNGTDTCSGGTCVSSGGPCVAPNVCDEGTDTCVTPLCTPPVAGTCDDGNVCTDDSFDSTIVGGICPCVNTNNTAACNDGNACTSGDVCSGGVCGGTAVSCDDANSCTLDSCDPATGCVNASVADGTPCTEAPNGVCQAGVCMPGVVCDIQTVTISGGGQKASVDAQIQTTFTVTNVSAGGCITSYSKNSVQVTPGTDLRIDWTSSSPAVSSAELNGSPVAVGSVLPLANVTSTNKLILDNKGMGGRDTDRITIKN